jgi:F-type H+-transporting ATPase subunit O
MANSRQVFGAIRGFATTPAASAAAQAAPKPPIQLHGLEGRYAHAIYAAAARNNQLQAVEKDFAGIQVRLNI